MIEMVIDDIYLYQHFVGVWGAINAPNLKSDVSAIMVPPIDVRIIDYEEML